MDIKIQKCDGCETLNTTNEAGWVRSYGVFVGAPVVPPGFEPGIAPNAKMKNVAIIDLCPTCVDKNTITDLANLTTPSTKPVPAAATATAPTAAATPGAPATAVKS
jgi:hypothetical protein